MCAEPLISSSSPGSLLLTAILPGSLLLDHPFTLRPQHALQVSGPRYQVPGNYQVTGTRSQVINQLITWYQVHHLQLIPLYGIGGRLWLGGECEGFGLGGEGSLFRCVLGLVVIWVVLLPYSCPIPTFSHAILP